MDGGGATDVFSMSTEGFRALLSVAVAVIVGLLFWIIRKVGKVAKTQDLVNDLVLGDDERDMRSMRQRFTAEKADREALAADVKVIRAELTDNHGNSLKDAVRQIQRDLKVHLADADALTAEFRRHISDKNPHD